MGYNLYIRIDDPDDPDEPIPIPEDEWFAWVDANDDFEPCSRIERRLPNGQVLSYEDELMALWKHEGREVPFSGCNGELTVKNPDDAIILRMMDVADALGAEVYGDEGERYIRADNRQGYVVDDGGSDEERAERERARSEAATRRQAEAAKPLTDGELDAIKPWWKRMLGL